MRYQQPAGKLPGAAYEDGNLSAGILGDIPPAAAIEHPMRELVHLISYAGLEPVAADLEQVRKAVEMLIAAALGGGEPGDYLTLAQAASRLPIYPEVNSADGRIGVSSPAAGTVLVPPTVAFLRRGIEPRNTSDYSEAERSFATSPGKTYHLRWSPGAGFALRDLADPAYNPGVLAEGSPAFDTDYDDMLVSRVVTSSTNVATITNLINRDRLFHNSDERFTTGGAQRPSDWAMEFKSLSVQIDFSRTPRVSSLTAVVGANMTGGRGLDGYANMIVVNSESRYGYNVDVSSDFSGSVSSPYAQLRVSAGA